MTKKKSDAKPIAADYMPLEQEMNAWTQRSRTEGI
jgi:hypothetical protein